MCNNFNTSISEFSEYMHSDIFDIIDFNKETMIPEINSENCHQLYTDIKDCSHSIIRKTYSESEELSILRHYSANPENYIDEWDNYNNVCENAKKMISEALA